MTYIETLPFSRRFCEVELANGTRLRGMVVPDDQSRTVGIFAAASGAYEVAPAEIVSLSIAEARQWLPLPASEGLHLISAGPPESPLVLAVVALRGGKWCARPPGKEFRPGDWWEIEDGAAQWQRATAPGEQLVPEYRGEWSAKGYAILKRGYDAGLHEVMHWGPGHIVFEDSNFEDEHIRWCINEIDTNFDVHWRRFPDGEIQGCREVLSQLLEVPERERATPEAWAENERFWSEDEEEVNPSVECGCRFDPDPNDPDEDTDEKAWHYRRKCANCACEWYGLHCPHDGIQNPCPGCGVTPEVVPTG